MSPLKNVQNLTPGVAYSPEELGYSLDLPAVVTRSTHTVTAWYTAELAPFIEQGEVIALLAQDPDVENSDWACEILRKILHLYMPHDGLLDVIVLGDENSDKATDIEFSIELPLTYGYGVYDFLDTVYDGLNPLTDEDFDLMAEASEYLQDNSPSLYAELEKKHD